MDAVKNSLPIIIDPRVAEKIETGIISLASAKNGSVDTERKKLATLLFHHKLPVQALENCPGISPPSNKSIKEISRYIADLSSGTPMREFRTRPSSNKSKGSHANGYINRATAIIRYHH